MIKKLLAVLIFAVVSTAMFAADPLTFRYSGDPVSMAGFAAGYEVEAAIRIPASVANRYAGASITKLQIFFGNSATSTNIFIRTSDTDPGYSQAATFKVQSQNDITLTTPYVIPQNQDIHIGYHYKGGGTGAFYSMVLDDAFKAHSNGGYFRAKTGSGAYSAWYTVADQGWGNLCIAAVIEGDNLPQAEVEFLSLTTAPQAFIDVNESFSLQGEIKNWAAKTITEMEVSYQIGSEPKVSQTIENLNIASGNSYQFTIQDIDFPKTAGINYLLTVTVEKINGLDDEKPANNTQTATLKVWNSLQNPIAVATTPARKNSVIEEYTGIRCQWCPDGHKRVNQLMAANPKRVCAINIHQGGYANPGAGDPDYRTQWGNALADQTGLTGYPAGTVNRHKFSGYAVTASDRTAWSTQTTQILGQNSYVNVAVRTSVNAETRKLTAIVELYYTANGAAQNNLNVAILQDSIMGPQIFSSGLSYPEMQHDGLYQHNHMLRDLLTGQWGDLITSTTAGTFVSKKYEWDIPAAINGIPVNPAKLEVVAFVAEGRQEIITGASSHWSDELTGLPVIRVTDFSAYIHNNLLHIQSSTAIERVTVYNVSGQKMLEKTTAENTIPVNQLQPGVYIVKVKTAGGGEGTVKVIK